MYIIPNRFGMKVDPETDSTPKNLGKWVGLLISCCDQISESMRKVEAERDEKEDARRQWAETAIKAVGERDKQREALKHIHEIASRTLAEPSETCALVDICTKAEATLHPTEPVGEPEVAR